MAIAAEVAMAVVVEEEEGDIAAAEVDTVSHDCSLLSCCWIDLADYHQAVVVTVVVAEEAEVNRVLTYCTEKDLANRSGYNGGGGGYSGGNNSYGGGGGNDNWSGGGGGGGSSEGVRW